MRTLDTNPEADLALVQDGEHWASGDNNTRYIPLYEAPLLTKEKIAPVYLRQLHYVAAHIAAGLVVHDRVDDNGMKPPRTGWTRWQP